MAIKRTIRGIRDKIPGGYIIGRIGKGQGPAQLIRADFNNGRVSGGGSGSGVTTIAIEMYAGALMRANEVLGQIIAPVEFTLPAMLPGSFAIASTASVGTVVLSIRKATVVGFGFEVGTITFTASNTGVIVFASDTVFAVGDRLLVRAPATVDSSLANTTILLLGNL